MAAIKGVSPRHTPTIENIWLRITGDGFLNATCVYFEDSTNTKVTVSKFDRINDSRIDVVIPALAPGPVYVSVIVDGETATVEMANVDRIYGPTNMTLFGMVRVEEPPDPVKAGTTGYTWKITPGLEQK
ncbi:IPT/TIG domain-containing protein [Pandoraea commovens]|uniref:IPT/TIG domain-containing protein n=1 Tax=Pandoraea commovens TaxID=2508289 RepID=A0A5E4XKX0_9BURK|nr:IPT/TIG domain-containing protein [Pandoraea commovens]VVE36778.1 hypothetical protein PCO31010_03961 [Pandoraea commovens]